MNPPNTPFERPEFGPGFGRGGFRGRGRGFGPMAAHFAAAHTPPFEGPSDEDDPRHDRRERRGRRGGPGFGPGFGPGGPGFGPGFGPGGRGFGPRGRGRGRGRKTARGDIRLAVLTLVAEQPRHGYEIIQEIAERSGGAWRPSPGSVYPTLSQLEDEGLVTVEKTEGRRVVSLTEAGTAYVAEHREELDKVWESVNDDSDDDGAGALWEQLGQLHAAAHQVMSAGTPEQIATASEALAEARKTIYRLLAE
jgi:DNA-binding PadR family transcriptional regulator